MKKFSELLNESFFDKAKQSLKDKDKTIRVHPTVNPVDSKEIFEPLIELIESYSGVQGPGETLFDDDVVRKLKEFIDLINKSYIEYVDDGTVASFLPSFMINLDYGELIDCLQPIIDRSEFSENTNFETGVLNLTFNRPSYKIVEDFTEDVLDAFEKMKMFNINYMFTIATSNYANSIIFKDDSKDVENLLTDLSLPHMKVSSLTISIYNNKTLFVDQRKEEDKQVRNNYLRGIL